MKFLLLFVCFVVILAPSFLSGLVWGPLNFVIHLAALLFFSGICIIAEDISKYLIPPFAVFFSFMPFFDWLDEPGNIFSARLPRTDLVLAQLEWHLVISLVAGLALYWIRWSLLRIKGV